MKFTKSLLIAAFAFSSVANAQEEPSFSLSGQFRPRTEWFGHGQSKTALSGTDGYIQTSVRAALNATYKTSSYTTYIGLQEVFLVGDRTQISNAGGNLRVQHAWADIKLSETTSFKVGRQPLVYDDQRILGGLDWAQQARTHDVGVFKFNKAGYSVDAGYSLNTTGDNIYDNSATNFSYREMAFIHANKKFGNLNISLLALSNTFQISTENKSTLLTAGTHLGYSIGGLTLKANGYIQNGYRNVGGLDVTVDGAFLASIDGKYKISDKLTAGLGYEIISGKEDDSAAFFPLYGTNHLFNGLMDRFYVGNHGNAGGLKDAYASVSTKLSGAAISLTGHAFSEQSQGKDDLGTEIDLTIAKGFKGFKVVGGYSQFFEPDSVVGAKDTQNWAWLMLIISPKFL